MPGSCSGTATSALAAATAWSAPTIVPAASLYVDSTSGDDSNDGSAAHPFRTAQHCQNQATLGTTCVLRAGTYRESISINKNSVAFRGDGAAVLSGLDLLDLKWERDSRPCTWRAPLSNGGADSSPALPAAAARRLSE